jgi:transposase
MLHVGGINGFLPNSQLVYKAGSATGDYHGQMNSANFEKWAFEKLVPNLPPHAAIFLDNAPYHCIQVDKPPSAYALKSDMISWLRNNGVDCNATMHKDSLYKLIVPLKPKEKAFKIDRILSDYGHTVVRLPPYMCDLNPIELAWAKIKRIVREHNVTADLSLQKLLQTAPDSS